MVLLKAMRMMLLMMVVMMKINAMKNGNFVESFESSVKSWSNGFGGVF